VIRELEIQECLLLRMDNSLRVGVARGVSAVLGIPLRNRLSGGLHLVIDLMICSNVDMQLREEDL
jgi:hypothetical protein